MGSSPRTDCDAGLYGSNSDRNPASVIMSSCAELKENLDDDHDCQTLKRTKLTIKLHVSIVEVVHEVRVLSVLSWCVYGVLSGLELGGRDLDELLMCRFM